MARLDRLTARPRRAAVALGLVAVVWVTGGLLRLDIDSGMNAFLPAGDPAITSMEAKAKSFGGDPIIVLLQSPKPRQLLESENLVKLVQLEGEIARLPDVAAVYGPGTVLNQTAGAAQDMLAQISGRRDGMRAEAEQKAKKSGASKAETEAAGRDAVREFDQRYGALLVQGLPAGLPTLKNQQFVNTVMYGRNLDPRPEWRFVLPRADMVSVLIRPREGLDQEAGARLVAATKDAIGDSGLTLRRETVTGAPALTAALTERARAELPLLGIASVVLVGLVFWLVPWSRKRRPRALPVASALLGTALTLAGFGWLGVPVSIGVVAFLPILLGIGSDFPLYLFLGGRDRRALVAAGAAAVGFASLLISPLPFVRELGAALAVGTVLTSVVALVLRRLVGVVEPADVVDPSTAATPRRRWGLPSRAVVAALAVAPAVVGWVLLPGLRVESEPEQLARGLTEVEDVRYAEKILGSSGEINIVVRGDDVARPEVLEWSRTMQADIVRRLGDQAHPVISTADLFRFLGEDPTASQVSAAIDLMPRYLTTSVLRSDRTMGVSVIGVEFDDVERLGVLLDAIETAASDPPPGVTVDVAGLPVAAVRGLELVSENRIWMNLLGIGAAGLVILVGLRSVRDAVRAVTTVALATGWVALLASVTTGSLSPLTVAIGSLVTATGVEFAVMLHGSRGWTVTRRHVATAAGAGTVGYLVLGLSQVALLREFGLLLAGGVALSFLAAVVVTEVTGPRRSAPEPETQPTPEPEMVMA